MFELIYKNSKLRFRAAISRSMKIIALCILVLLLTPLLPAWAASLLYVLVDGL